MVPVYINELCLLYHRNLLTNTQQQLFNGRLSGQPVPGDQDNPSLEIRTTRPWRSGQPVPGDQDNPAREIRTTRPWRSGQPVPGDQDNPARELEPQLAVTLTSCSTVTVLKFPTSMPNLPSQASQSTSRI